MNKIKWENIVLTIIATIGISAFTYMIGLVLVLATHQVYKYW